MKKIIPLLLSLLLFSSAWRADAQKRYFGIKGGYTASNAYFFHSFFGPEVKTSFESGFQTGVVFMNFLRRHVGLQIELNYTQKGWKQRFANGLPDFVTELDYVELPLLANVHTGKKHHHFYAAFGCFVEYLLRVRQSQRPTTQALGQEPFYPFNEGRDKKIGYGFRGGFGVFYDFRWGTLMLESNFSYSLSDMLRTGSLASGVPNYSKNLVIGASLGYLFSFGEWKKESRD